MYIHKNYYFFIIIGFSFISQIQANESEKINIPKNQITKIKTIKLDKSFSQVIQEKIVDKSIEATGLNKVHFKAAQYTNGKTTVDNKTASKLSKYFKDGQHRKFFLLEDKNHEKIMYSTPACRIQKNKKFANGVWQYKCTIFQPGGTWINRKKFNNLSSEQQNQFLKKENDIVNTYRLPFLEVGGSTLAGMGMFYVIKKGIKHPRIQQIVTHDTTKNSCLSLTAGLMAAGFVASKFISKRSTQKLRNVAEDMIEEKHAQSETSHSY